MGALFSDADYRDALLALLPRGRAWPREPGSVQHQVASGLSPTFGRLDARAQALLLDAFPASTVELLSEWEASLGLPDPCDGEDQTLEQRRNQVVVRLVEGGGQSIAYYLAVLARLGYPAATITEYAPFRTGVSPINSPLTGEDWWHVWTVNLPGLSVAFFRANASTTNEPLLSVSSAAVFCTLAAIKPGHTILLYTFDPV